MIRPLVTRAHTGTRENTRNVKDDMPEFCFLSSHSFTGGPLAINQGVARANTLGANAAVMYVKLGNHARVKADGDRIVSTLNALQRRKVDKRLKALSVPECRDVPHDTVLIVPEAHRTSPPACWTWGARMSACGG